MIEKNLVKSYEDLVERINAFQSNGPGCTIYSLESVFTFFSLPSYRIFSVSFLLRIYSTPFYTLLFSKIQLNLLSLLAN